MYKSQESYKLILLFIHLLLGYLLSSFTNYNLSTFLGIIIIITGSYYILSMPDPKNQYPILFSAYIVGLESGLDGKNDLLNFQDPLGES